MFSYRCFQEVRNIEGVPYGMKFTSSSVNTMDERSTEGPTDRSHLVSLLSLIRKKSMTNNAHNAHVKVIYCLLMHATYTTLFGWKMAFLCLHSHHGVNKLNYRGSVSCGEVSVCSQHPTIWLFRTSVGKCKRYTIMQQKLFTKRLLYVYRQNVWKKELRSGGAKNCYM
jgi:hypothetical protein